MSTPLARLLKAVHTVPLTIARPFLFWWAAHKRRSGAWRVRPPSREAQQTRPEPAIRSLQASIDAVRAMRAELGKVLDGDESHRQTYRNLARFERKFDKYGLRTIEQLPVDQLRRALREFESLVRNWSSASLADLRSRMAVVLADRSSAASVWIAANSINGAAAPRARHRHAAAGRHRARRRPRRGATRRPPRRHVALQLGRRRLQLHQRTRLAAGVAHQALSYETGHGADTRIGAIRVWRDAVPYPNDRRKHQAEADEVLSPEYLAMLIACGGEVRAADRDVFRQRQMQQRHGRRKDDLPLPDQDRRRQAATEPVRNGPAGPFSHARDPGGRKAHRVWRTLVSAPLRHIPIRRHSCTATP